jgi:hypothetical protein
VFQAIGNNNNDSLITKYSFFLIEGEIYSALNSDRNINIYNLNIGSGYNILENLGLFGLVVLSKNNGYSTNDYRPELGKMDANSWGVGLTGLIRWQMVDIFQLSLFLDGSFGAIYYDRGFPPQGTNFNYILRFGGGISYQLTEKNSLKIGCRFMHISNGKGWIENNPAINSLGGIISWRINF